MGCWCETGEKEKTKSIADGEDTIKELHNKKTRTNKKGGNKHKTNGDVLKTNKNTRAQNKCKPAKSQNTRTHTYTLQYDEQHIANKPSHTWKHPDTKRKTQTRTQSRTQTWTLLLNLKLT